MGSVELDATAEINPLPGDDACSESSRRHLTMQEDVRLRFEKVSTEVKSSKRNTIILLIGILAVTTLMVGVVIYKGNEVMEVLNEDGERANSLEASNLDLSSCNYTNVDITTIDMLPDHCARQYVRLLINVPVICMLNSFAAEIEAHVGNDATVVNFDDEPDNAYNQSMASFLSNATSDFERICTVLLAVNGSANESAVSSSELWVQSKEDLTLGQVNRIWGNLADELGVSRWQVLTKLDRAMEREGISLKGFLFDKAVGATKDYIFRAVNSLVPQKMIGSMVANFNAHFRLGPVEAGVEIGVAASVDIASGETTRQKVVGPFNFFSAAAKLGGRDDLAVVFDDLGKLQLEVMALHQKVTEIVKGGDWSALLENPEVFTSAVGLVLGVIGMFASSKKSSGEAAMWKALFEELAKLKKLIIQFHEETTQQIENLGSRMGWEFDRLRTMIRGIAEINENIFTQNDDIALEIEQSALWSYGVAVNQLLLDVRRSALEIDQQASSARTRESYVTDAEVSQQLQRISLFTTVDTSHSALLTKGIILPIASRASLGGQFSGQRIAESMAVLPPEFHIGFLGQLVYQSNETEGGMGMDSYLLPPSSPGALNADLWFEGVMTYVNALRSLEITNHELHITRLVEMLTLGVHRSRFEKELSANVRYFEDFIKQYNDTLRDAHTEVTNLSDAIQANVLRRVGARFGEAIERLEQYQSDYVDAYEVDWVGLPSYFPSNPVDLVSKAFGFSVPTYLNDMAADLRTRNNTAANQVYLNVMGNGSFAFPDIPIDVLAYGRDKPDAIPFRIPEELLRKAIPEWVLRVEYFGLGSIRMEYVTSPEPADDYVDALTNADVNEFTVYIDLLPTYSSDSSTAVWSAALNGSFLVSEEYTDVVGYPYDSINCQGKSCRRGNSGLVWTYLLDLLQENGGGDSQTLFNYYSNTGLKNLFWGVQHNTPPNAGFFVYTSYVLSHNWNPTVVNAILEDEDRIIYRRSVDSAYIDYVEEEMNNVVVAFQDDILELSAYNKRGTYHQLLQRAGALAWIIRQSLEVAFPYFQKYSAVDKDDAESGKFPLWTREEVLYRLRQRDAATMSEVFLKCLQQISSFSTNLMERMQQPQHAASPKIRIGTQVLSEQIQDLIISLP